MPWVGLLTCFHSDGASCPEHVISITEVIGRIDHDHTGIWFNIDIGLVAMSVKSVLLKRAPALTVTKQIVNWDILDKGEVRDDLIKTIKKGYNAQVIIE